MFTKGDPLLVHEDEIRESFASWKSDQTYTCIIAVPFTNLLDCYTKNPMKFLNHTPHISIEIDNDILKDHGFMLVEFENQFEIWVASCPNGT